MAIEKAKEMQLNNICLESDSLQVVNAFNKDTKIPWRMRARWFNCRKFCNGIVCSCLHVLRDGNQVADALVKNGQGLAMFSSQWWQAPPSFLFPLLDRDSTGSATIDWLLIDLCLSVLVFVSRFWFLLVFVLDF
jgi:hypothetical protein